MKSLLIALSTVLCSLWTAAASHAAPVTFRFEAEVASMLGESLPFPVSLGDSIRVVFTFEPNNGIPPYPQPFDISMQLNDTHLAMSEYLIHVQDNAFPGYGDIPGRIADPENTPIVDFRPPVHDYVTLSRGQPLQASPVLMPAGQVVGFPELKFDPLIVLAYPDDVLVTDELGPDISGWNGFSLREMGLTFLNVQTNRESYIGAYIGSIAQIPEPGSLMVLMSLLCITCTSAPHRCRRRLC